MAKAKFSGNFTLDHVDPVNGEVYIRPDGVKVLVWWDYNTKLWAVYAVDNNTYQISDSEYVVRSDVPWAIESRVAFDIYPFRAVVTD